ncbi:TetR/AcrR family transcriptional regulator [Gordonia sp. CPCC 205515]|uniref:TetR/AcrR family transcriptional regulator n=1 Tax=Gordonia sp. CPCC 205515 TaxID=3140791 RepID=UPI003AF3A244
MPQRSYGGRSVAERQAERFDRFMAAALDVFGTQGYAQGTVSAVCSAAGLSRRQFYELFESREDLLIAAYDMIHAEARDAVIAAFGSVDDSVADVSARVRPGIAAFFDSVAADPRRMRIAFIEVAGVSPRVEAHRLGARAEWTTFFSAMADTIAPELSESEFGWSYEAAAFVGALTEAGHLWTDATPRPDRDVVVDMLMGIIMSFVRDRMTRDIGA